jgi:hypothetical protein
MERSLLEIFLAPGTGHPTMRVSVWCVCEQPGILSTVQDLPTD